MVSTANAYISSGGSLSRAERYRIAGQSDAVRIKQRDFRAKTNDLECLLGILKNLPAPPHSREWILGVQPKRVVGSRAGEKTGSVGGIGIACHCGNLGVEGN